MIYKLELDKTFLMIMALVSGIFAVSPVPIPDYRSVATSTIDGKIDTKYTYEILTEDGSRCNAFSVKNFEEKKETKTYFLTAAHCFDYKDKETVEITKDGLTRKAKVEFVSPKPTFGPMKDYAVLKGNFEVPVAEVASDTEYKSLRSGNMVYFHVPGVKASAITGRVAITDFNHKKLGESLSVNIYVRKGMSGSGLFHDGKVVGIVSHYNPLKHTAYVFPVTRINDSYIY